MMPQLYKTVFEKALDGSYKPVQVAMTQEEMAETYKLWDVEAKKQTQNETIMKCLSKIAELESKTIRPTREIALAQIKGLVPNQEAVDVLHNTEAELVKVRLDLEAAKKALSELN